MDAMIPTLNKVQGLCYDETLFWKDMRYNIDVVIQMKSDELIDLRDRLPKDFQTKMAEADGKLRQLIQVQKDTTYATQQLD